MSPSPGASLGEFLSIVGFFFLYHIVNICILHYSRLLLECFHSEQLFSFEVNRIIMYNHRSIIIVEVPFNAARRERTFNCTSFMSILPAGKHHQSIPWLNLDSDYLGDIDLFNTTATARHEIVSLIRLSLGFVNPPRRVWQHRRALVATHCHHSILCRRSREASAANELHYRDATLKNVLPDLTFQSDSCVNIIKV